MSSDPFEWFKAGAEIFWYVASEYPVVTGLYIGLVIAGLV